MERLTRRSDTGHAYYPRCFEEPCNRRCEDCLFDETICERLAAYEDSECEPEEVLPKDKADEIAMKPVLTPILSSMLYIIEDGEIYEDALCEAVVGMSESGKTNVVYTTLSDQIIFEQADIGKTVFLTREEAKKALEAMRKEKVT